MQLSSFYSKFEDLNWVRDKTGGVSGEESIDQYPAFPHQNDCHSTPNSI